MNNQGWGLREMIILSAIILFFVILESILISNLYSKLEMPETNKPSSSLTYTQIEENLKQASKQYYKKYKTDIGNIILSEDLIKSGYLKKNKLSTSNDTCEGYVIIDEDFMPFITCANYETEGY